MELSGRRTSQHLKGGSRGFFGEGYLPSLSINHVGMSKDMGKRLPQLYYRKMKISFDLGVLIPLKTAYKNKEGNCSG